MYIGRIRCWCLATNLSTGSSSYLSSSDQNRTIDPSIGQFLFLFIFQFICRLGTVFGRIVVVTSFMRSICRQQWILTRVEYCAGGASAWKVKFSHQMRLILTAKFGPHTWHFDTTANRNRTMSFDKYTEFVAVPCMCLRLAIVAFMWCGGGCLMPTLWPTLTSRPNGPGDTKYDTIPSFGWRRRVTPNPFRR